MASPEAPVAVVGGAGLLGQAIAEQLEHRGVPPGRIHLSDFAGASGQLQEIGGKASVVAEVDPDLLALADEVFLCVPRDNGRSLLTARRGRGSVWIDLSGAAAERARVPLVNLNANPQDLPARPSGLIAAPGPEAQLLSTVLAPLQAQKLVRRVRAMVLVPASRFDRPGLDELYRQSVQLLNFGEVPREVFGDQLAFNLLPADVALVGRAADETRRLCRLRSSQLVLTALLAPVFHGHGAVLHVATTGPADPGAAEAALRGGTGIEIVPERIPSPVALAGESAVAVASPRDDGSGRGLWLWATSDDLAAGAARNAVRIAGACRGG